MELRLIQVFLSHKSDAPGPGIFEVSSDNKKNLYCTCPGFVSRSICKHVKVVASRIERNKGNYPFDFVDNVTKRQITEAMKSESEFRDFVIQHAKIEVY